MGSGRSLLSEEFVDRSDRERTIHVTDAQATRRVGATIMPVLDILHVLK